MTRGLFLFFQKQSRYSTSFQNAVAAVCRGTHFHVEVGFGYHEAETGARELDDDCVYTAYMFEPFTKRRTSQSRYARPEEWDIVFIALTEAQIDRMKQWVHSEIGVGYDYVGAFLAPVANLYTTSYGTPTETFARRGTLFCSEAAVIMLQIGSVREESFRRVNPRCCTPEALYQLVRRGM